jgi:FkbM family methyltransferase
VGTNIGVVCLNMAKRALPGGRVIGFEPDPISYAAVMRNVALSSADNVEIKHCGVGEKEGTAAIACGNASNRGENYLTYDNEDEASAKPVTVHAIDSLVKEEQLPSKIDVIKIDVEGFEMNVLRGAEKTIINCHPRLFVEVNAGHLARQATTPQDLVSYIQQLGYDCYDAASLEQVFDNVPSHLDIVCMPHGEEIPAEANQIGR